MIVTNNAAICSAKLTSQSGIKESTTTASVQSLSSSLANETVSVFKKPSLPHQSQKVPLAKANDHPPLKSLNDDVDMKSATSVCSMDFNVVDLTGGPEESHLPISNVSTTKAAQTTKLPANSTTSSKATLITVQVVQDGVVDLTGDDDEEKTQVETKKPIVKQKKEPATEKPAQKKKTTISEDTKMKIRDAIFSNKLAKQKGNFPRKARAIL